MSLNKVQRIINLAYNFYRIASEEDEEYNETPSGWEFDQIKVSENIKQIANQYDEIKRVFTFLTTARDQKINVLEESDESSIAEYYSDFLENITELVSIAMVYEKEFVGYEDLKDKIEFIQSEYFQDKVVETADDKIQSSWDSISRYVDSIEQNILDSEYLKNKAIENNSLDLSHESSEEYQKIKETLISSTIEELRSEEAKEVMDLGSNLDEDGKNKGSGVSVRNISHIDLAAKNMEKFIAKKEAIYAEISSYLINLNEKYKIPALKAVKFDSSGEVKNMDNLNINQLVTETSSLDDFAKNSAKLIEARFSQYKILLEIEKKYPELKDLLEDLKAKVKSVADNDWFGTDQGLSNFRVDTKTNRDETKRTARAYYSNNKAIQQINGQIEMLLSTKPNDPETAKSIANLRVRLSELSNISKQLKNKLNEIKEQNKLNVNQYIAVNKQPGTFAYYKNRLDKIKKEYLSQWERPKDKAQKFKAEQVLGEINQALKEIEVETQEINQIDSFIKNTYVQKLRNIENRVVKPLQVQLEGISYPEDIDLTEINNLVNSDQIDMQKFSLKFNQAKNKILSNIDNLSKILADPKHSWGLSNRITVEKFKKSIKDETNAISFDPKRSYDKGSLSAIINKLKQINDKVMNQLDSSQISSAYKSKPFVGTEGKELIQSNLFVALDNLQNRVSGKLTNEFPYALMRNKAFKEFIESDGFKKVLEKRKQFKSELIIRAADSEKRVNDLKANFAFPSLMGEMSSIIKTYLSLNLNYSANNIKDNKNIEKLNTLLADINSKLDLHAQNNKQDLDKVKRTKALIAQTGFTVTEFSKYNKDLFRDFFKEVRNTISSFFIKYKEKNIGLDSFSEFYINFNELNSEIMALKNLVKIGESFAVSPSYETEKEIVTKLNSLSQNEQNALKITKKVTNSDILSVLGLVGKTSNNFTYLGFKKAVEEVFNAIKENGGTFDDLKYDLRIYDINSTENSVQEFISIFENVFRLTESYIQKLNIYEKAYNMIIGKIPKEELKSSEELMSAFETLEDEDLGSLDEIDFDSINEENEESEEVKPKAETATTSTFDEITDEEDFLDNFFAIEPEEKI